MYLFIGQVFLMIMVGMITQPKKSANYHNYLNGTGAAVLEDTVGTLEMMSDEMFMSDPEGQLTIIFTYGELPKYTLGLAMRGERTCRIIVSHVMNPETSVSYDEADLKAVLTHEIGHCFGMDHYKKEDHIMYWAYNGGEHSFDQVTEFVEDLKKYRNVSIF